MSRRTRQIGIVALALLALGAVLLSFFDGDSAVEDTNLRLREHPEPVSEMAVPDASAAPALRSPRPLWRTAGRDTVGRIPDYPPEWSTEGRVLVDVSGAVAAASAWRVGDRLVIDLPQLGERQEPVIDHIDEGLGHSRSARALTARTDGKRWRTVVTVGPGRVFAYIDTATGPYELMGNDRLGWLLPSSSMMAGFDFSEPDYLLPERRVPDDGTP